MSRPLLLPLLLVLCAPPRLALAHGSPAAIAADEGPEQSIALTDSVRLHRAARSAQARFERVRRSHLPRARESFGGPCFEIIGRYCFSGGGDGPDWVAPEEHRSVTAARETLLDALREAHFALPGDGWIAGQRVRYLLEGGRVEEALRAASECLADRWWCHALGGLAHHEAGAYDAAESAFASALAAMPGELREEWIDLSLLLGSHESRVYGQMSGSERVNAELRFWWLADPFYLVPGNDRATEHYARHVRNTIQEHARPVESARWAWDHREILIRFGWPLGWQISMPSGINGTPSVVSHYPNVAPHFLPPLESTSLHEALPPGEWPKDAVRPRSWYSPRYAPRPALLEHQLARFRRGDSVLVVAVLAPPRDTALADSLLRAEPAQTGLFIAAGPGAPMLRATRAMQERSVVLSVIAPREPLLASLEWLHHGSRKAARARYGLAPHGDRGDEIGVSDLLVLDDVDSIPASLAAALEFTRASTRFRPGERIGLLWEVYGSRSREDRVITALELSGGEPGALRRLAERARIVRPHGSVALRWEDVLTGDGPHTRTLSLELPHRRPGVYDLELTVSRPGRPPVAVVRRIEVIP